MQELVVCWPISKLANIASWVLWRKAILILVLLDGVASSLDYTLGGAMSYASLISWRYMFRVATHGERHNGDALGASSATDWAVGTFGKHCVGGYSWAVNTCQYLYL